MNEVMMTAEHRHPPTYTEVTQHVAYLQYAQCLVEAAQVQTVTLAGMISLLASMQDEYGSETTLESIIQHRVGLQLEAQHQERQRRRKEAMS